MCRTRIEGRDETYMQLPRDEVISVHHTEGFPPHLTYTYHSSQYLKVNMTKPTILLLGTCDTKLNELLYTRTQLESQANVILLDLGRASSTDPRIDIKQSDIIKQPSLDISKLDRAEYIDRLLPPATGIVKQLYEGRKIHGAIGIGGSCGTALATGVMRNALPVGFPKLMVSTMASGDVSPYIEETDITMMYSVVDIAGTNRILNRILCNAAAAICGMGLAYFAAGSGESSEKEGKKRVGVTMFGVTTPGVDKIREYLEQHHGYEVYVFHATGAGGKAMERLVNEGQLDAVLDLTTSEIADEIGGGVLTAGPKRLEAAARAGIPQVVSVGACDMINFGPSETIPAQYKERLIHCHNPTVTLVRTSPEECEQIAMFIAQKLRVSSRTDFVRVILPTGGISMLDMPGLSFHDPAADSVLFSTLEKHLEGSGIPILRHECDVNDPEFAVFVAKSLVELIEMAM